jgi:hypothetical protein
VRMMSDQRAHAAPVLRASEIGQHDFCARGWWLGRVKGYRSAHVREMADGVAAHRAHGRRVMHYSYLQRVAYVLLILAGLAGALWLYLLTQVAS